MVFLFNFDINFIKQNLLIYFYFTYMNILKNIKMLKVGIAEIT